MSEITFNKRIALVKKEVFELVQANPLSKGTGCGYYSIKTIMGNLNPIMDKYNIDLDITMTGAFVECFWIDCLSDAFRSVKIELRPISSIEKLPMMQNIIQTEGSIMTYYRRYAITNLLNLNATDLIENNGNIKPMQQKQQPRQSKIEEVNIDIVNSEDLKALDSLIKEKNVKSLVILNSCKKKYGITYFKDLNKSQFKQVIDYLKSLEVVANG